MRSPLIICGPTATGKTRLALELCTRFPFEIVSADSRHVYSGMDIITGKDIPADFYTAQSSLVWHGKYLTYVTNGTTRMWLTDVVTPNEPFNLAFFHELAFQVIPDILARDRIPLVVGATGLYIKSLITPLPAIYAPQNVELRAHTSTYTTAELLDQLRRLDPHKAATMNTSDRHNPLRLIRAIEVAQGGPLPPITTLDTYHLLQLTAPREYAYRQIDHRVSSRLQSGALDEVKKLHQAGFDWNLQSMHTSGYKLFEPVLAGLKSLSEVQSEWQAAEHHDFRQQDIWYRKQGYSTFLDVSDPAWLPNALELVSNWYNI